MILLRLKEFWERQGDSLPSGYQRVFLNKRIVINGEAQLVGVVPLTGEKRGKRDGKTYAVPREQPQRTGAVRPRLVQDNANYSLGLAGEKDQPEKVAQRYEAYLQQLRACYLATHEPTVAVLLKWHESGGPVAVRGQIDVDLDELLFEVNGTIPTDLSTLQGFWATASEAEKLGRCLVTGLVTSVTLRMPFAIKGIPDGQTSGTMLVTVNNPSGESYGLEAGLNSPIGTVTAESVCNGLNFLLADSKHSLRIGSTVYLYWTQEPIEFDFMGYLNRPSEDSVRALLQTAIKGAQRPEVSAPDFFVLCLSANASRIVVRDFQETTLTTVQDCLKRWFKLFDLVDTDGPSIKPLSVFKIAASLYRDSKDIPRHVPVELLRSALTRAAIPKDLLALAVKRNVAMQGPYYEFNKKRLLSKARLALIKAVLLSHSSNPEEDTLRELNLDHPDPAYHCGRLLSVLESIQKVALPGLNATLVDKHYGSASGSPSTSFGVLLRDATSAHLPKLRKNRFGAFMALDQRLQEVLEKVGQSFPKSLDFERQGLFALGYYHQKAHDIAAARHNKELKELAEATGQAESENE